MHVLATAVHGAGGTTELVLMLRLLPGGALDVRFEALRDALIAAWRSDDAQRVGELG